MTVKIALVTGANGAPGAAPASALAKTGAIVVMVGRAPARGETARRGAAAAGRPAARRRPLRRILPGWPADPVVNARR